MTTGEADQDQQPAEAADAGPDEQPAVIAQTLVPAVKDETWLCRCWPPATSFLRATNWIPGPASIPATLVVTGSSPAQPCAPALSAIVQLWS